MEGLLYSADGTEAVKATLVMQYATDQDIRSITWTPGTPPATRQAAWACIQQSWEPQTNDWFEYVAHVFTKKSQAKRWVHLYNLIVYLSGDQARAYHSARRVKVLLD